MPFILDSDEAEERDRSDFVHEALAQALVPLDLYWPEHDSGVQANGIITDLGDFTICSGRTSALRVERTPSKSRDTTPPSVFVHVQLGGSNIVVQEGREAVARPGDLVIYNTAEPYTLVNQAGVAGEFFRITHAALALPADTIRQVSAVRLSPGHPLTALTDSYLRRLAMERSLPATPDADLVGSPTAELVRAVIMTHLRAGHRAAEPLANTLPLRLLEYARAHLHDPGLNAEQLAAAHHISVRYLYQVLARHDISLSEWIRTHRLEACRQALARAPQGTTIAAVARRHGFSDMSSFSRAFRAEFGMSPREWRQRNEIRPTID